ncbi:hypothetical protein ABT263_10900 [Kitasatospora sp. NPDC001603]|uniref:hypothetical protein n=1 Tax=Kitasatospora sp. NPDC001603 TaxID=3154388 RepID=UPI00332B14B6
MATPPEPDYGHTLSVQSDDLKYFADTQLGNYLKVLKDDPGFKTMLSFGGDGGGEFASLLVGHGSDQVMPVAGKIRTDFKNLATGVATDLKTLGVQMTEAQLRIRLALTLMDAAHEEAMTAAEMMEVLTKVSTATAPKAGGPNPG